MKLTGNLKKEVDNIDTKEGKKEAIKKAGMLLSDSELERVSGGGDDYDSCGWSPTGLHEWEDYEISPNVTGRRCKWCLIRLY